MSTLRFSRILFLCGIGFVCLVPAILSAQSDETETLVLDTQSTTTEPVVSLPPQPVYRLETLPFDDVVGDFVMSPGKIELEIAPGESETVEISVANRIGKEHTFSIEIEDVRSSNDPKRSVELLGSGVGPYTIKDYISIQDMEFSLPHAKRAVIPVTISIPPNTEPGGLYGSVLVKTVTKDAVDGSDPGTVPSSAIVSRIGALFFVSVPGEVERSGLLQEFSTRNDQSLFTAGPIDFDIVYENKGSVHLNPYGEIRITNILGEEVGFVELQPWFVLPGSVRLREIQWDRETLFGRYVATIQLNRGYDDVIDTATLSFWVIPWKFVLLVIGVIFIGYLLIRAFFRTFEFKRK